jgi:hypothetical protein
MIILLHLIIKKIIENGIKFPNVLFSTAILMTDSCRKLCISAFPKEINKIINIWLQLTLRMKTLVHVLNIVQNAKKLILNNLNFKKVYHCGPIELPDPWDEKGGHFSENFTKRRTKVNYVIFKSKSLFKNNVFGRTIGRTGPKKEDIWQPYCKKFITG